MSILAPSILSADFSRLAEDVGLTEKGGARLLHMDIMDGHFVPNISFGPAVVKSLTGLSEMEFDVHLMIEDPDRYIDKFVTEKTRYIVVHQEACDHLYRTLNQIRDKGVKNGVALNPATPLCMIEDVMDELDLVLIMSVEPGFSGQKFIPHALEKVKELKKIRDRNGYGFEIEIDGGVNPDNIREVADAGADIIVAGSAVFGAEDITSRTKEMIDIIGQ